MKIMVKDNKKSSTTARVISGAIAKRLSDTGKKSSAKDVDLVHLAEKLTKRHMEEIEQGKDEGEE
jgi:hypothetical protein